MSRRKNYLIAALSFIFFCRELHSQQPPELSQIAKNGAATKEKLADVGAKWSSVFETPSGLEATVTTETRGPTSRLLLSMKFGKQIEVIATIIERDGFWYVEQRNVRGKYRPYEAPFDFPAGYMFLAKSQPVPLTLEEIDHIGNFSKWEGKTAVFVGELPESTQQTLRSTIDAMTLQMKQGEPPATLQELFERTKRILNDGVQIKIDTELGLIVQNGTEGNRFWTRDFQFTANDEASFDVDPKEWTDFTAEITSEDSQSDIIMAMHQPIWRPGQRGGDGDMVLMDIKKRTLRRVPIPVSGGAGCFSKDSSLVYLSSLDIETGALRIVEVNLKTHEQRSLGTPELETGYSLFPVLSPNGRFLAVLHKAATSAGSLDAQVYLIDIQSGKSRKLGMPMDTGPVSWLPDGTGLVVNQRESIDMKKPPIGHLCIMNLDGKIKPIIDGDSAVVLEKTSRILYCENGRKFWKTCDLEGNDARVFGDGLKAYSFPAPSRDGKRLIMMKFDPGVGPKPHIVDLETGKSTPIPVADGLWSNLTWR